MAKYKEWLDKDKLILLRGWARDGLTNEQIANNIGINTCTLYEWKKKNTDISNALKETREIADYEVENALYKNAINGNVTAQIFWLKNRKSFNWREKVDVETNKEQLDKVEELLSKIESEANR